MFIPRKWKSTWINSALSWELNLEIRLRVLVSPKVFLSNRFGFAPPLSGDPINVAVGQPPNQLGSAKRTKESALFTSTVIRIFIAASIGCRRFEGKQCNRV
jgi:hypothetical protein